MHIIAAFLWLFPGQSLPAVPHIPSYTSLLLRAAVESPGGELPFIIQVDQVADGYRGWIVNGSERREIPSVVRGLGRLIFNFEEYDSRIDADSPQRLFHDMHELQGTWKKRTSWAETTSMQFNTRRYEGYLFKPNLKITEEIVNYAPVSGRWSVKFADDGDLAVGVFKEGEKKTVEGTFLTTTGDYRYLAGSYEYGLLRLSCFDGAHAFLFVARMQPDGTLIGDFWAGAKGHDTWTAKRDDKAELPDGFSLTKVNPKARLKDLKFPGLDGKVRSLGDLGLLGKATIIEIFGSWCPNCHDAAELLVAMDKKYTSRGLKVVGLAFEATGNLDHDAKQVRTYLDRHHASYPVLLAGVRDKEKASAALPVIDKLRGYPTFLFVDGDGIVRSVYTGFSGPATGEEYAKLRKQFENAVEKLLAATVE